LRIAAAAGIGSVLFPTRLEECSKVRKTGCFS
jgi:hypothetical protein